MSESSWFKGYNERYFFNKGALIACMYKKIRYPIVVLQSIRNSKKFFGNYKYIFKLYGWYAKGMNDYLSRF